MVQNLSSRRWCEPPTLYPQYIGRDPTAPPPIELVMKNAEKHVEKYLHHIAEIRFSGVNDG